MKLNLPPKINFVCLKWMPKQIKNKYELRCDMQSVAKYYCLRRKTPTKMFEKMKSIYSDDCLSGTQVFALHKEFSEGRETAGLHDSQRSGWPPTVSTKINVNTVRTLIEDHSLTFWVERWQSYWITQSRWSETLWINWGCGVLFRCGSRII